MFTFKDLQDEVKRRSTRDQGGTQFDISTKNIINTSLFRVAREANWRQLRSTTTFSTEKAYTTGSGGGTFTNNSANMTVSGGTLLDDGIRKGRRVKLQGDSTIFTIVKVVTNTAFSIDQVYTGTTISGTGTFEILPTERYSLPPQVSHRMFMWHEDFGYPYKMKFLTDQHFFDLGLNNTDTNTPTHYRMWEQDMVEKQVLNIGVLQVVSSVSTDTNVVITVFGIVNNIPDFEELTTHSTDSTIPKLGSKSFSKVDRVVKSSPTTGTITVTSSGGSSTLVVIPTGDVTGGILYKKVRLYPLPTRVFTMNVWYYKDPWRLVNDGDVHDLGQEFDEAIILLATMKLKYEQGQTDDGDRFAGMYKDEIKNLKRHNVDKLDFNKTLQKPFNTTDAAVHPSLLYRQAGSNFGPRV